MTATVGAASHRAAGVSLAAGALGVECPLLPTPLTALVSRVGSTWVDPDALLPHHRRWCKGERIRDPGNFGCPLREPRILGDRALLLWIDDARYPSPREWLAEGRASGPAIPVSAVPPGFALGETWVLVAHRRAAGHAPGIVHVFRPTRIDRIEVPAAA